MSDSALLASHRQLGHRGLGRRPNVRIADNPPRTAKTVTADTKPDESRPLVRQFMTGVEVENRQRANVHPELAAMAAAGSPLGESVWRLSKRFAARMIDLLVNQPHTLRSAGMTEVGR